MALLPVLSLKSKLERLDPAPGEMAGHEVKLELAELIPELELSPLYFNEILADVIESCAEMLGLSLGTVEITDFLLAFAFEYLTLTPIF
jgi:hypothetical protein